MSRSPRLDFEAAAKTPPGRMTSGESQRHREDDALRTTEARFRALLGVMPAAVYTCDAEGRITFFNEHAGALWGQEPELGDSDLRFCGSFRLWRPDGDHMPHEQTPMAVAVREGQACRNQEVVIERPDGTRITVLVNIDPLRDDHGRLIGAINVFHEITALRDAQQALRVSEERYRAVVESQAEMVCRFRVDGTIIFANSAYARALGCTPESMVGANFWEFIPRPDHGAVRAALESLTPETPEARIENRFETGQGVQWLLWTNRALTFGADGRVEEAQSTGMDITERKLAEETLRETDRRKNDFLATLAHELRNPLAPLRHGLHLVRTSQKTPAEAAAIHEMMDRQLSYLVRLVDDLLEISRIDRGALELRHERVNVATIVRDAVETASPLMAAAKHQLEVVIPPGPLHLWGDPVRLSQVLANLLNNAAHYTSPGGRIELTARAVGAELHLIVRDNGRGISADAMPGLFEMFGRSSQDPVRGHDGLGIGLPLSRRLVEMHGGTLTARSDGPDRGSEFVVRLPLAADASLRLE